MFTRCPDCHAIYPLRASWIAQNQGKMECGRCGKFFSAINYLFDDWPEPDETPPIPLNPGDPFHLSHRFQEDIADGTDEATPESAASDPDQLDLLTPKSYQWLWNSLLVLLIPLTIANFSWQFRAQLLKSPAIYSIAEGLNLVAPKKIEEKRDPEQFQLLSRDMHPHPSRPKALILSLTLVNRADYRQGFPGLEITLLDSNQQAIARRQLHPRQYLPEKNDLSRGLAPDTLLPVVVEFSDPGATASGFEIRFL